MSTQKLTSDIKVRVPTSVRKAFEEVAKSRHLELSDIAREAFREFLARQNKRPQRQAA
jgi:predicted transcriptional regulator